MASPTDRYPRVNNMNALTTTPVHDIDFAVFVEPRPSLERFLDVL
jgi:hypothetical protein